MSRPASPRSVSRQSQTTGWPGASSELLGDAVLHDAELDKVSQFLRTAGREGDILNWAPLSNKGDDEPRVFKEVEHGPVSAGKQAEVDAGAANAPEGGSIRMTRSDVVQGNRPTEEAELELQSLGGEMDSQGSVVECVEEKEREGEEEHDSPPIQHSRHSSPGEEQEEKERKPKEQGLCSPG